VTVTAPLYLAGATFHVLLAHQGSGTSGAQGSSVSGTSIRISRCQRTRKGTGKIPSTPSYRLLAIVSTLLRAYILRHLE
jgi:hypothetical protein